MARGPLVIPSVWEYRVASRATTCALGGPSRGTLGQPTFLEAGPMTLTGAAGRQHIVRSVLGSPGLTIGTRRSNGASGRANSPPPPPIGHKKDHNIWSQKT